MINQPFTLGVNYWPRRKAMFWWSNFDAGEVKEEFTHIKELGMNLVRIFLKNPGLYSFSRIYKDQ